MAESVLDTHTHHHTRTHSHTVDTHNETHGNPLSLSCLIVSLQDEMEGLDLEGKADSTDLLTLGMIRIIHMKHIDILITIP